MATHPSILAWRIPWTEEPGGLQSMGHKQLDTTEATESTCMLNNGANCEIREERSRPRGKQSKSFFAEMSLVSLIHEISDTGT